MKWFMAPNTLLSDYLERWSYKGYYEGDAKADCKECTHFGSRAEHELLAMPKTDGLCSEKYAFFSSVLSVCLLSAAPNFTLNVVS